MRSVRDPTSSGTQVAKMSQASSLRLLSSRSTCLTACLGRRPRAWAKDLPMSATPSEAPVMTPSVAFAKESTRLAPIPLTLGVLVVEDRRRNLCGVPLDVSETGVFAAWYADQRSCHLGGADDGRGQKPRQSFICNRYRCSGRVADWLGSLGYSSFLRGGFHNSLATLPATRKMHAAWSSDWMMKPRRS